MVLFLAFSIDLTTRGLKPGNLRNLRMSLSPFPAIHYNILPCITIHYLSFFQTLGSLYRGGKEGLPGSYCKARANRLGSDLVLDYFWIATGLVTPQKHFYPPPKGEGSL